MYVMLENVLEFIVVRRNEGDMNEATNISKVNVSANAIEMCFYDGCYLMEFT